MLQEMPVAIKTALAEAYLATVVTLMFPNAQLTSVGFFMAHS
jgi:hypothetical protein